MSAFAEADYAAPAATRSPSLLSSRALKRLVVAVVGCAVMAMSGTGLANYLDTSGVTGADSSTAGASQADAASLN